LSISCIGYKSDGEAEENVADEHGNHGRSKCNAVLRKRPTYVIQSPRIMPLPSVTDA
jgi:hypothetical protein